MPNGKPDFTVKTKDAKGTTQARFIEKVINIFYSGRQESEHQQWIVLLLILIAVLATVGVGTAFWYFTKESPCFEIQNPILRSDATMIIQAENNAADHPDPLNVEFDGLIFGKKGIPEKKEERRTRQKWHFDLSGQNPTEDMLKQGKHPVRIGFPGEPLSDKIIIVFKNRPPIVGVETFVSESHPDVGTIRGKAASELQIPGEKIAVEVLYFHEGTQQEIDIPVRVKEDEDTGIIFFEFETSVQGLPQLSPDDPRYAAPFFGFRITDQAGNAYFQEQSYAQYMAPGCGRFGFNELAMIKVEKLLEGNDLHKNIIRVTPTEMLIQRQLANGEPAILLEVKSIASSRKLKWKSNVTPRKPVTLVFRDDKQLGTSFTDEYTDDEELNTDTVIYKVEQEGEDGTKYRSNDEEFTKEPAPIPEPDSNSLGMKFVYIRPGTFMMGSPNSETGRDDDETLHQVTLTKGFYMQTTEVSQKQWRAVMGKNPSHFKDGRDDCPVENVSWEDAQQFIKKLNGQEGKNLYRLPTEAEWEYACRAGSSTRFCFGDDENRLSEYAWYDGNSGGETHPVGQKKPNAWGLYDMHGNVWEWCRDWFGDYPSGDITDPAGPLKPGSHRVGRGGGYFDAARHCRSAIRAGRLPGIRVRYLGFRLLRLAP